MAQFKKVDFLGYANFHLLLSISQQPHQRAGTPEARAKFGCHLEHIVDHLHQNDGHLEAVEAGRSELVWGIIQCDQIREPY